jgi:hypothetical protein
MGWQKRRHPNCFVILAQSPDTDDTGAHAKDPFEQSRIATQLLALSGSMDSPVVHRAGHQDQNRECSATESIART